VFLFERKKRGPIVAGGKSDGSAAMGDAIADLLRHTGGISISDHVRDLLTDAPSMLLEELHHVGLISRDARPEIRVTASELELDHATSSKALCRRCQQQALQTRSLVIGVRYESNDAAAVRPVAAGDGKTSELSIRLCDQMVSRR
jgi:hypothetical protein